jgi:processive 1,2-diacylglycerol beta-glucosyltransferase
MKTIFVCSAGFGEGHNAAARGILDALERLKPEGLRTEFLDLNARVQPRRDAAMRKFYLSLLSRAPRVWAAIYWMIDRTRWLESVPSMHAALRDELARILEEAPPAAVVSTFPFYGYLLDEIARRGGPTDFARITVVTDSISINSIWYRFNNPCFLVPNEDTAAAMRQLGVAAEKLHVTGFPVSPRFADALPPRAAVNDPEEGRRVLLIINSHKHTARSLVKRLLRIPGVNLTVTAGRDDALRRSIEEEGAHIAPNGGRLRAVMGWTKEIPELLASHHVVISKAGGATVQEAIAAGCPMIMNQVAPGQEEGNADLLLRNEAGALAENPDAVVAAVERLFADDGAVWRRWSEGIMRMSRPRAAFDTANFILAEIARRESAKCAKTQL